MKTEKLISAQSGYLHVFLSLVFLGLGIYLFTIPNLLGIAAIILFVLHLIGFMVINPNQSAVLTLFGDYRGTIVKNGFFWVKKTTREGFWSIK